MLLWFALDGYRYHKYVAPFDEDPQDMAGVIDAHTLYVANEFIYVQVTGLKKI